MQFRVGNGFDAHRFAQQGQLILGGVEIPYDKGMQAHSDGDVVLHALCDAILGALAKGDIGQHFPDTDSEFKNIDSRVLLKKVVAMMQAEGFRLQNTDITIIAQQPKMLPYTPAMRQNIASDLQVQHAQVNVKATTTEKMGFTGRGEGIAVQASVLLTQD